MGPMENGSLLIFKQHIRTLKTCEVHMLAAQLLNPSPPTHSQVE